MKNIESADRFIFGLMPAAEQVHGCMTAFVYSFIREFGNSGIRG
jgi:hypothetical protein